MLGYETHDAIDGRHAMSKSSSIQRLFNSPSISTIKAGSKQGEFYGSPSMAALSVPMAFPPSVLEPATNVSSALDQNVSTSMLQQTGERSNKQ